jgi:MFS family permease
MFAILSLPYGILSAVATNFMPVVLRDAKVLVGDIGWFSVITWTPMYAQFLYAPLVDALPYRRSWFVSAVLLGTVSVICALWLPLPKYKVAFLICTFAALLAATITGICNGGLMAILVEPNEKAKTSGWYSAGILGGMALATWLLLSGFGKISLWSLSACVGLLLLGPALFVAFLPKSTKEENHQQKQKNAKETFRNLWKTIRSHLGWSGLLLCGTPMGTVALTAGGFATIAEDFQASHRMIAFVNGAINALVVAAGSILAGYIPRKIDRRKLYVLVGILTIGVDVAMALSPVGPSTYATWVIVSFFIAGLAASFFYTIVLDTITHAGGAVSTYYTLFTSASNFAIAYTTLINARLYERYKTPFSSDGPRALLLSDALLNMIGVVVFSLVVYILFKKRPVNTDVNLVLLSDVNEKQKVPRQIQAEKT